jgi:hypothetical protein
MSVGQRVRTEAATVQLQQRASGTGRVIYGG